MTDRRFRVATEVTLEKTSFEIFVSVACLSGT
jgi:hypothetical protein